MSVFRRAADRLADFLYAGRKVSLHFIADYDTARYVLPLIKKLIADDEDGETYRTALVDWHRVERPPLALYDGEASFCRIDGPLQWVGDRRFPLGGLVLSSGVTAHLDPFEADALYDHMKATIERAIREWIAEHGLRDWPRVPVEFDRTEADRKAKAMIADWAARQERENSVAEADTGGPDHV